MNAKQLRESIKSLNSLPDEAPVNSWLDHRINLRNKILKENPERFLTWPTVQATMFVGNTKYTNRKLEFIFKYANELDWPEHYDYWQRAIQQNSFGGAESVYDSTFGEINSNFVNQVYHLKKWENEQKFFLRDLDSIVEFGGGYGAMAFVCRRLGFVGKYTIVDFPEFLLLQEYYLSNVLDTTYNINFINTFDDYDIDANLMIALCSLSEADNGSKDRFFNQVNFKYHLILFQPTWGECNNEAYFASKVGGESILNPYFNNHRYLIK